MRTSRTRETEGGRGRREGVHWEEGWGGVVRGVREVSFSGVSQARFRNMQRQRK